MVFSLSRQLRTLTIRIYQHSHGKLVLVGLVGELASDELPPGLVALVDNFDGVLLGLGLTREGEDVLMSVEAGSARYNTLTSGFPSGIL